MDVEILEEFVGEIYVIQTVGEPLTVDFTFYTDREVVEKRVAELNKMARFNAYWYVTLYRNHREFGEDYLEIY